MDSSVKNEIEAQKCTKKYAIFLTISDNYSFAAANVIMGLKQFSLSLLKQCDIIIFNNGISEKNKDLLKSIHQNIYFKDMVFPKEWDPILSHEKTLIWGSFVICKLFGFDLIQEYEKALHLDADMLIRGDISDIFEIEEDLAWRRVISWDPDVIFRPILMENESICVGSGGLILFNNTLNKYKINKHSIIDAFFEIKDLSRGGNDEKIVAWLAFKNNMQVKVLDVSIYDTPAKSVTCCTKIVHFLSYKGVQTKPWKNLAAYLYFTDWAENYQKWLQMGGEGLVQFTQEDYYKLFAFDKAKRIDSLKEKVKKLEQGDADKYKKLDAKYNTVIHSTSWKITKPMRVLANMHRKFKKKVKSCFKK